MKRVEFIVPGPPVSKGRPRARVIERRGKKPMAQIYTPTPTRKFEAKVKGYARQALAKFGPLDDGPRSITVTSVIKRPERLTRKKDPDDRIRHDCGPLDADNLLKAIMDGVEGTFYENDNRLSEVHASKWYAARGEAEHTRVVIETLDT